MGNQQNGGNPQVSGPLLACLEPLAKLWRQAGEESAQQSLLFEQWTQEVRSWAHLTEWSTAVTEAFRSRASLWLPHVDATQFRLLLALAGLADALGCNATQLTLLLLSAARDLAPDGNNSSAASHCSQEIVNTQVAQGAPQTASRSPGGADTAIDYHPLIEALTEWQTIFELALDEAAARLDKEVFPAEDLSASLSEMCDLLRAALARQQKLPERGDNESC